MDPIKIQRINMLSKKEKEEGLTPEEKQEQKELRAAYIQAFRNDLKQTLDSVVVVDPKGNKKTLKRSTEH